jgi:hypothetical protein
MGKGGYTGGSTIVGPQSGWFSHKGKVSKRKPMTLEKLATSAERSAKAVQKQQAEQDAYFASIQGMLTTIGQTAKARKRLRKRKKAQAAQRR